MRPLIMHPKYEEPNGGKVRLCNITADKPGDGCMERGRTTAEARATDTGRR